MPNSSPESADLPHIEDKLQFLKESIDEVVSQLQVRQRQKQGFLTELEQRHCETKTSIYELEQQGDVRYSLGSRRRIGLEKEIETIEKEARQQELEYWRDVTALQKELRQLKKEYRAVRVGLCLSRKK